MNSETIIIREQYIQERVIKTQWDVIIQDAEVYVDYGWKKIQPKTLIKFRSIIRKAKQKI